MTAPFLTVETLTAPGLRHGFFGRAGGVSKGVFASLNVGLGSTDDPECAAENRRRCEHALFDDPPTLLTLYQVHSPRVVIVDHPWKGQGPQADAMATRERGLALGVLAADCMPFLFADMRAGVIAAAHAGWRGALAGVLEATVKTMIGLGASPADIRVGVGPCLRQPNFEVGLDLVGEFLARYPDAERFFTPGKNDEKRQLDLVGFGRWRLGALGVETIGDVGVCTFGEPDSYFSYRAGRRRGEDDYGRNLSAIALVNDRA